MCWLPRSLWHTQGCSPPSTHPHMFALESSAGTRRVENEVHHKPPHNRRRTQSIPSGARLPSAVLHSVPHSPYSVLGRSPLRRRPFRYLGLLGGWTSKRWGWCPENGQFAAGCGRLRREGFYAGAASVAMSAEHGRFAVGSAQNKRGGVVPRRKRDSGGTVEVRGEPAGA